MKLYLLIFTSVVVTLLLCWTLEPMRQNSGKDTQIASSHQDQTSFLAATRFVTVGIPGWGGWGSAGWPGLGHNYMYGSAIRYGNNPYSFGQLRSPGRLSTPGYSYWRLPGKGLLMLSPNHRQHYFPTETPDHPPVPWETND